MPDPLLHFTPAASALGLRDTRTVQKLCERHRIPVVRLSRTIRAIRESDYALLLAKLTDATE